MTAIAIKETQSSHIWFCTKGEYVLASVCLCKCLKTFLWWYLIFDISPFNGICCMLYFQRWICCNQTLNDVVRDMSGCDLIPFCVCTTKCSYDLMKLHTTFQIWLLLWTRHIVEELLGTCSCHISIYSDFNEQPKSHITLAHFPCTRQKIIQQFLSFVEVNTVVMFG